MRIASAVLASCLLVTAWSIGHALTVPGGGTVSERIAEWARNHSLGPLVTFGEWLTYTKPKTGGNPNISFTKLGGRTVHKKKHYHGFTPIIPANIGSPAGTPLPGEGVWKLAVSVKGHPAVFKTYVRQSRTYSSYYAGIVSMDQRLLKFSLRPGTEDPGYGHWGAPMDIPSGRRLGLVATFNSGFIYQDGLNGDALNGHTNEPLKQGLATLVGYKDGRVNIVGWDGGPAPGPAIAWARQSLPLIIDHSRLSPKLNGSTQWG